MTGPGRQGHGRRARGRPGPGWSDLARIQVEPGATVYAEGWQSWSIVSAVPVTTAPYRVTSPESLAIDCQYAVAPPPGVHQGSGLLAIDPGGGGPVQVFGADEAMDTVPLLQARRVNGAMVVSAGMSR
jgi:alpha-galactosidase